MEDDLKKIMQPKTIKNKRVVAPLRVTLYYKVVNNDFQDVPKAYMSHSYESIWILNCFYVEMLTYPHPLPSPHPKERGAYYRLHRSLK